MRQMSKKRTMKMSEDGQKKNHEMREAMKIC